MATIMPRRRKDGSIRYTALIRLKREGHIVHQESRTFDRRRLASEWAKRRELELQHPDTIARTQYKVVTISTLIERYIDEYGDQFGRTKLTNLKLLLNWSLASKNAINLTAVDLVDHVKQRREAGAGPSTCNHDLIWLRQIWRLARPVWSIPLDLQVFDDAVVQLRLIRWVGKSQRRHRRPTEAELDQLRDFFARRDLRSPIPMLDILNFAIASTRRQAEITRLRWDDLDEVEHSILVRDLKHPRQKQGNHRRAELPEEAVAIIKKQPHTNELIFPFNPKSIGAAFTRACKMLGIKDLRFHDLRAEGISRLFEQGYDIPRVALISLHESWSELKRYTRLKPGGTVVEN